jgi:hypothetical protein
MHGHLNINYRNSNSGGHLSLGSSWFYPAYNKKEQNIQPRNKPTDQPNKQSLNSMKQSPLWEVGISSADQYIPGILRMPDVYNPVHLSSILSLS